MAEFVLKDCDFEPMSGAEQFAGVLRMMPCSNFVMVLHSANVES